LEAVWHRACLDLIAALSLVDSGRLCGKIVSYKAGHTLDTRFMTLLYRQAVLTKV
jgi:UDP-3-O-acyl-N-acetylglucosamine deacetylase